MEIISKNPTYGNRSDFTVLEFTAAFAVALGLHLQLLAFDAHRGAGGHRLGDEGAGADDAAVTDYRFAA